MKLPVALALAVCVVARGMPLRAQAKNADGPLARAVSRESARLAATEDAAAVGSAGAERRNRVKSNWTRVRDIEEGTEVVVVMRDSPPLWGHLVDTDQSSITVANASSVPVRIARDDVTALSTVERRVGKGTGLGAMFGATAGFLFGLVGGEDCRQGCWFTPAESGAILAMFGGGIGSGIGAAVGAIRKTPSMVYRVP